MNPQILNDLNIINKTFGYKTEDIINYINTKIQTINDLKDKVNLLEKENSDLQDEIGENRFEYPDGFVPNIIMDSALEKMFANIRNIPADKLDEFVDQYSI